MLSDKILNLQKVHFVPKSSEISWGVCVPSSCSSEEISSVLKQKIIEVTEIPELYWRVEIRHGNCQVENKNWIQNLSLGEKLAM